MRKELAVAAPGGAETCAGSWASAGRDSAPSLLHPIRPMAVAAEIAIRHIQSRVLLEAYVSHRLLPVLEFRADRLRSEC